MPTFDDCGDPECGDREFGPPDCEPCAIDAQVKIPVTGLLTEVTHYPESCYGSPTHCYWHHRDEISVDPYRVCLECMHVYATKDEFIAAFNEFMRSINQPTVSSDQCINGCPYCGHD